MSSNQVLVETQAGIDEVSFAGTTHIETPVYGPEIKSSEDVFVLLKHGDALDDGAPILVPANTWRSIRSEPKFNDLTRQIEILVRNHPVIYREPVELFRYRRPTKLVSYGLGEGSSRQFYKKLREEQYDAALEQLPEFIAPFVEIQMERLLEIKDYDVPERYDGTVRTTSEAWTDKRANKGWPNYFAEIAKDAQRSPNAGVVPPVPPITSSSEEYAVDRTIGANHGMVRVCREVNEGRFGSPVYPYLHIYADYSILKESSDNDRRILESLRQEIKDREEESSYTQIGEGGVSYQGVVLTVSNLESAWGKNATVRLERFVENVATIARTHDLPVMMPRSNWYGLYLTDFGVQSFSSLLNGNETYAQGGAGINTKAKFGKTPLYGAAVHPGVEDAFRVLKSNSGRVHPVPDLPDAPTTFDPDAEEWSDRLGDPEEYRQFAKARRLVHAQEAREVRSGQADGVHRPAREYLRKSENNDFS